MLRTAALTLAVLVIMSFNVSDGFAQPARDEYDLFEMEFDWLEIEDIGEPLVNMHNNDFQGPFDIGYRFPFYGEVYEQFWVGSNGLIGFGPTRDYALGVNHALPDHRPPENFIALFWKDLDPEAFWADGMIYIGIRDEKRVIQFNGIGERNQDGRAPDNTITMQVVLDQDGDIILQYAEIGDAFDLDTGTIGLESREGDRGITLRHDGEGEVVREGTAFLLSEHGPGDFLVWDAGGSSLSGNAQEAALEALDHTVTHLRLRNDQPLPPNLGQFEAVFVNLGNFGVNGNNYHRLSQEEGQVLADYLEVGGNIYMEGGDTWTRDPATAVHQFFLIEGVDDGGPAEAPIAGLERTFAEGLSFAEYDPDDNDFVDQIEGADGSIEAMTFHVEDEEFVGMVAVHAEGYRTVGCSFKFGGLVDGDDGDKEELMLRIVEFFRAPPPRFPAPVNLRAVAGDSEVALSWDMPRRGENPRLAPIVELQHELNRLAQPRDRRKPGQAQRLEIAGLKREIRELVERLDDVPHRDELEGFNIYLNGEEFDFTNAQRYLAIELENGEQYEFGVSAVYTDPDGESEVAGPVIVVPTGVLELPAELDFEEFNGGFFADPSIDAWEWGAPEIGAANGERAWGTLLDRPYPDLAEYDLISPVFDLSDAEQIWFEFNHFIDCEGGWDGGRVLITTDGGERWGDIEPVNGYPEESVYALNENAGFSGTMEDWEPVRFDLSPFAGVQVRLRFEFRSDESNFREYQGWYIDDVTVIEPELGDLLIGVNHDNGDPLANALVTVDNNRSRFSNQVGEALFTNLTAGMHNVMVTLGGFQPLETEVEVIADQQVREDVFLVPYLVNLQADLDEVDLEIAFDADPEEVELTITNDGEDQSEILIYIDYFPELRMGAPNLAVEQCNLPPPFPRRDEPLELLQTIDLTEQTVNVDGVRGIGEQYFYGAQFVRGRVENGGTGTENYRFLVGAGEQLSGDCRFYFFDRSGSYIGHVVQTDQSGWGVRDLTYDYEFVYGSRNDRISWFNPNSGVYLNRFRGSPLEVHRAITYLEDENAFWVGNWDDTWYKIDRNERILDSYNQHGLTGVSGMAWNPSDPDGFYLYIHNQEPDEGGATIYRFNPVTREIERLLVTAEAGEGFAGGCFVTYLYDTRTYMLGAVVQGVEGDVLKLYELWPKESWITATPPTLTLPDDEGNEEGVVQLTLNPAGIYDDVKEAQLDIISVLDEREIIRVPITMMVQGGAATISGVVELGGAGDVASVSITLNGEQQINPEGDGSFGYFEIDPGNYVLRAELAGYAPYETEIELEPDEVLELEIRLEPIPMGQIEGHVVSAYEGNMPLQGATVSAVGEGENPDVISALTDDQGYYILDVPTGEYDVIAELAGWGNETEPGVVVEEDQEEPVEVDFVLDERRRVRSIWVNGNWDDRNVLTWSPPGLGGEAVQLRFDDNMIANAVYLRNRDDIIATRFEPEGMYDIRSLTIKILRRGELGQGGGWPNFSFDPIRLHLFREDPETGLPGERLGGEIYVDEHDLNANHSGWLNVPVDRLRFLEGPFYLGWSQALDARNYDAACLDEEFDHPGTCFVRFDGQWQRYDGFPGDHILRATVWSYYEEDEERLAPRARRLRSIRRGAPVAGNIDCELLDPAVPGEILPLFQPDWAGIIEDYLQPNRDVRAGFVVMVDGEPAEGGELGPNAFSWEHRPEGGSDNEDVEYTYSITTVYEHIVDDEPVQEEVEGVEVAGMYNAPPWAPLDPRIDLNGLDYTLSWFAPPINDDEIGTECVDYEACLIMKNGEQIARAPFDPDAARQQWEGSIQEGEEGWYTFELIAVDEVPNRSRPATVLAPLGIAIVNDFEDNDPFFEVDPVGRVSWNREGNVRNGPEQAHSGSNIWATAHDNDQYIDEAVWTLTTLNEYTVTNENASLEFYHYYSTEEGHDGGQVSVSEDGGDWELIRPEGGYPDQTVAAFRNQPAFTGENGDWELAHFDLGQFEGNTVKVRFTFASDASISWYDGWYIDDFVMWGCGEPNYATLQGIVQDGEDRPIEGAVISTERRSTQTDNEGFFSLENILPGEATVTASKPGYQSVSVDLEFEPDQVVGQNFNLIRPQLSVEPEEFQFEMGGRDEFEVEFSLTNEGAIAVPYWIRLLTEQGDLLRDHRERRLGRSSTSHSAGPRRDDPWDVLFEFNATEATRMSRIMGAEYTGQQFVLTASDPQMGEMVAVLDWQGNLLNLFAQPIDVRGWGLRDLAWDGELLYGSQDRNIYAFTTDGEAAGVLQGAPITVNRALAYDRESDAFWAAEWDSPWFLVDREGEVVAQWADHGLEGVYGLAYHPADEDGMKLYALNLEEDGSTGVYRANPENGEIEQVHGIDDAPTGCFITGAWDADWWILGAVTGTDEQMLTGYEISRRRGWIGIEPDRGELAAETSEDITVHVRVPDVAEEGQQFLGTLSIRAFGAEQITLPFQLDVIAGFRHFDNPPVSDDIHLMHVQEVEFFNRDLTVGSEIATITDNGDVGGVLRWLGRPGEFPMYHSIGGFEQGDIISFRVWDIVSDQEFDADAEVLDGVLRFLVGRETTVNLRVTAPDEQEVRLNSRWNLISIYVEPVTPLVSDVLGEINERGHLVIAKNGAGRFWWPRFDFNGLGDWEVLEGYQVNVSEEESFTARGIRVPPDTPIQLDAGWNMIAYLFDHAVDSRVAFAGIMDEILIAKNGAGQFIAPRHDFFGMGDMLPGQGFKVKVDNDVELIYQDGEELGQLVIIPMMSPLPLTGSDMSLLLTNDSETLLFGELLVEVRTEPGNHLVGYATVGELPAGIIIRGDDETTEAVDGAVGGENLIVEVTHAGSGERYEVGFTEGEPVYHRDGFVAATLLRKQAEIPSEFVVRDVYPNPFNNRTRVRFGVPEAGEISLHARDIKGRRIQIVDRRTMLAGWHNIDIDASGWSSGIYFLDVITREKRVTQKLVLIR